MSDIITVNNLTKKYGDFVAVDHISFTVKSGETLGILGPNGAGKTTTLEMMEGLKAITDGTVVVDQKDVKRQAREVKEIIGVQPQASAFFDGLNLKELLITFASLYNTSVDPLVLLRQVNLEDKAKNQVKELSGGQKQRLSIAVGLVNKPKVLFLDEPTTGLDPQARRNMWDLVEKIKTQGTTIVITTHYMEEAEILCDRVAIMDHAKIIALDTPNNLLRNSGVDSTISFKVDKQIPKENFEKLPSVVSVTQDDHTFKIITTDPEATLNQLFSYNKEKEIHMFNLQILQATLEDVFLKLTGKTLRE